MIRRVQGRRWFIMLPWWLWPIIGFAWLMVAFAYMLYLTAKLLVVGLLALVGWAAMSVRRRGSAGHLGSGRARSTDSGDGLTPERR